MDISSERLAYWFLRLNGFLTTYNFVVHPDESDQRGRYQQRTDVDVMGVRFPNRRENRIRPMQDADCFQSDATQFVLAETKSSMCRLNGAWRDSARANMQKVLSAAGIVPPEKIETVAAGLYSEGQWQADSLWVRWLCFGKQQNPALHEELKHVPQLLWARDVLPFVHNRFNEYKLEKSSHVQWDNDAKGLYAAAQGIELNRFVELVTVDGEPVL